MFFKQKNVVGWLMPCIIIVAISSCSDEGERPEKINKLRAIGVEQSPVAAKPGDTVQLTFYLAGPSQMVLTPRVLIDSNARYGTPVSVTPLDQNVSENVVGPLSLYSYKATVSVPNDASTGVRLAAQGYVRLRYNVAFSQGTDEESIVGDTIVYAPNSPQLNWTAPTIAITKPAPTASAGTVELDGNIDASGTESNRVSWFVSGGKVKNRRAKTTSWQDAPKGSQAIFMTVRGTKTGAFALQSLAVTID